MALEGIDLDIGRGGRRGDTAVPLVASEPEGEDEVTASVEPSEGDISSLELGRAATQRGISPCPIFHTELELLPPGSPKPSLHQLCSGA